MTIKPAVSRPASQLRRSAAQPRGRKPEPDAGPARRRFTRDEYYRMGELGLFDQQRVQLVEGEVLSMTPQNSPQASVPHDWVVDLMDRRIEIRRQPAGGEYGLISLHRGSEILRPLLSPRARIVATPLLP
jgi:Uma2 family endonuclease